MAVMLLVAVVTIVVLEPRIGGAGTWYFLAIGGTLMIVWVVVGSLVASREPRNPIGWIVLSFGLAFAAYALCTSLGPALVFHDVEAGVWITWLGTVFIGAPVILPFLFLLFPNGHLPSPRWRPLAWLLGVTGTLVVALAVLTPDPDLNPLYDLGLIAPNPAGIAALEQRGTAITSTLVVLLMVAGVLSVVSLWIRYRRSAGDERQQIRWLSFVGVTAAVMVVLYLALIVLDTVVDLPETDLWWILWFFPFVITIIIGIPVATGIAILRYRLYDLDVVIRKTVQAAILVVVFALIAVIIALAVPTILVGFGGTELISMVVMASILALTFTWIRGPARRLADRIVYGRRATPYEVLSEFSERVGETYEAEGVLPRMAAVLGEGAGAERATVWLRVGGSLRPEAVWPADAASPSSLPDDAVDVVHQGETLGALSVTMPADDPMNPAKEKLVRDLAGQAGLVLRNVQLIRELKDSRRRLVTAQDEERRKLERNIHDGAQQQLVALQVKLRLAEQLAGRDAPKAGELLTQLQADTGAAIEDLRDLARGIYPPLLADQGLAAALEAQARKAAVPTTVRARGIGRYPQDVEAAVYFTCLEALQNTAKYAAASSATVSLSRSDGHLLVRVVDDGRGFDPAVVGHGTGLQGMADRLAAIGGDLTIESAPGAGTQVVVTIATEATS
jgi:signal transduction histidine kinase